MSQLDHSQVFGQRKDLTGYQNAYQNAYSQINFLRFQQSLYGNATQDYDARIDEQYEIISDILEQEKALCQ